jgi:hypothetical protein
LAFYPGSAPAQGVRSTSTLDAAAFRKDALTDWSGGFHELKLTGDVVSLVYEGGEPPCVSVIATCTLPDTLEELIQWARMVHAMHGGEHE